MQEPGTLARHGPRILIVTLAGEGGVPALVDRARSFLGERGWTADLAWYEPYRQNASLAVPFWALPFRRPKLVTERRADGTLVHRVGVRLPELEARRHRAGSTWRQAMQGYDVVLAICGSILQAGPPVDAGRPCLAWISSPFDADREARRRRFSRARRIFDALLDAPLCRREERRLLRRAAIVTNSDYTRRQLLAIEPHARIEATLPWALPRILEPVPERDRTGPLTLGFAGRLSDPRKNLPLLIEALALLRSWGVPFRCQLAGLPPAQPVLDLLGERGLSESVSCLGWVDDAALARFYRELDLFVVPSQQEGLSVVALEAMAAGVPVVSTRCGGPEDFVIDGETGLLTGHDASALAQAIRRLAEDPALRRRLGREAAQRVRRDYGYAGLSQRFWRAFDSVYGEAAKAPAP